MSCGQNGGGCGGGGFKDPQPVTIKTQKPQQQGQLNFFKLPPVNVVCQVPPAPIQGQNAGGPRQMNMGGMPQNMMGAMPQNLMGAMPQNMMGGAGAMPQNMMGGMPQNMMGAMPQNMMGAMPQNIMGGMGAMPQNMMGGMPQTIMGMMVGMPQNMSGLEEEEEDEDCPPQMNFQSMGSCPPEGGQVCCPSFGPPTCCMPMNFSCPIPPMQGGCPGGNKKQRREKRWPQCNFLKPTIDTRIYRDCEAMCISYAGHIPGEQFIHGRNLPTTTTFAKRRLNTFTPYEFVDPDGKCSSCTFP